jgi:hypothetical protein
VFTGVRCEPGVLNKEREIIASVHVDRCGQVWTGAVPRPMWCVGRDRVKVLT